MKKKALVIQSGGSDSTLCLALAIREFGKKHVLSVSFNYEQRHLPEIVQAKKICQVWEVDHVVLSIECLKEITESALIGHSQPICLDKGGHANTLVIGRNGLMARLGAIHAQHLGAHFLYMGIIEVDALKLGYRDCTREYMDLKQQILRLDLADPLFEIRTPLVHLRKEETFEIGYKMGILDFILEETITCYKGIPKAGCKECPSCEIRNQGLRVFSQKHPEYKMPYKL